MKGSDLRGFVRRHRHAEEVAVEAVGLNLLWFLLRVLGVFGAGFAIAAVTQTSTYHPTFSLSQNGAAFLIHNEGVILHAYNDPYNCTVGVGHLIHYGGCSSYDYARWNISMAQAQTMLVHDVETFAAAVRDGVTHPISQPQFDALVDLAYNIGGGGFDRSRVRADVNSGYFSAVPGALLDYQYASGRYLSGLHTRRVAEGRLFLTGDYGSGIGRYVPPPPPKPLTAAQKRALMLKHRTGYFAWLGWYLGEKPWRHAEAQKPSVRPNVPTRIPPLWWRHERRFLRARSH